MMQRAERLNRQFFRLNQPMAGVAGSRPVWEPPVDIVETEGQLVLVIALPGVDPAAVQVRIEGRFLKVSAFRPAFSGAEGGAVHRLEIPYGQFERTLELQSGVLDLRDQKSIHGCLVLTFDKVR